MKYHGYEDTDLIPELKEWKALNGEDFDIADWLVWQVTPELTIGYSAIFCPEIEEVANGIFYKNCSKTTGEVNRTVNKHYEGDLIEYQIIENYRYIVDFLYLNVDEPTNPKQIEFLGHLLEKVWGYQLQAEFPHLKTTVKYYGLDINSTEDANITFWAEPKEATNN